ncbi:MAG: hypothetical protein JSV24_04220 [Bacteroidales bacterium]|nr:MAG: hypothetical protein JSV24_04220 [Bacteroidales bacterium]
MKTRLYWILALVITLAAAYYQRTTGPTRPKKVIININNTTYKFKFVRTHGGTDDCEIILNIPDTEVNGKLFYKRFPTNDEWTVADMIRDGETLKASLPQQPPAGKLAYYLKLETRNETVDVSSGDPVIIRFKGDVPAIVMVPHILLMFIAMLLSTLAGLLAIVKHQRYRFYGILTVIFFFTGGLILGPVVQYYAFGEAWTGIPFGWDLTDNKTLISFIVWLVAVILNLKKKRPAFVILAAVVLLVIYSIPHSLFGSEFDYTSGEITQGFINFLVY